MWRRPCSVSSLNDRLGMAADTPQAARWNQRFGLFGFCVGTRTCEAISLIIVIFSPKADLHVDDFGAVRANFVVLVPRIVSYALDLGSESSFAVLREGVNEAVRHIPVFSNDECLKERHQETDAGRFWCLLRPWATRERVTKHMTTERR